MIMYKSTSLPMLNTVEDVWCCGSAPQKTFPHKWLNGHKWIIFQGSFSYQSWNLQKIFWVNWREERIQDSGWSRGTMPTVVKDSSLRLLQHFVMLAQCLIPAWLEKGGFVHPGTNIFVTGWVCILNWKYFKCEIIIYFKASYKSVSGVLVNMFPTVSLCLKDIRLWAKKIST